MGDNFDSDLAAGLEDELVVAGKLPDDTSVDSFETLFEGVAELTRAAQSLVRYEALGEPGQRLVRVQYGSDFGAVVGVTLAVGGVLFLYAQIYEKYRAARRHKAEEGKARAEADLTRFRQRREEGQWESERAVREAHAEVTAESGGPVIGLPSTDTERLARAFLTFEVFDVWFRVGRRRPRSSSEPVTLDD